MKTNSTKEKRESIVFRTHKSVLDTAKYYAEKENRSLNNYIETLLKRELKIDYPISKNIPNAETKNAIQEARKGIGLTKMENLEDLLNDFEK